MHALREIIGALTEIQRPCVLATLVSPEPASGLPMGSRRLLNPGEPVKDPDEGDLLAAAAAVLALERPGLHHAPGGALWLLEGLHPGRLAPWIHFAAQQRGLGRACVPATLFEVRGDLPYQVGETFALDEHSHGLVPLCRTFNAALHHACARAREEGATRIERLIVPGGEVAVLLDPL